MEDIILLLMTRKMKNSDPSRSRRKTGRNNRPRKKQGLQAFARIADTMIHKVMCADAISFPYVPNSGFSGTSQDLTIAVCQNGILFSQNGGVWNATNFNNYASLAAVFQEYRITEFSVEVFFSENTGSAPASATSGAELPMLYTVVDREDAVRLSSISQALQYSSVKISQLGTTQGPKTTTIKGPAAAAAYDNDATFVGTITAAGVTRSPWLSCGSNSGSSSAPIIPHGFVKYYADPVGSTFATQIGTATFIVRAAFEYRGID
jgi:hypothetical protein